MLNEQAIKEFQDIYFSEYGEAISFDEASAKAESLLRLYRAVFKPSNNQGDHNGSKANTSSTAQ